MGRLTLRRVLKNPETEQRHFCKWSPHPLLAYQVAILDRVSLDEITWPMLITDVNLACAFALALLSLWTERDGRGTHSYRIWVRDVVFSRCHGMHGMHKDQIAYVAGYGKIGKHDV